MTADTRFAGRVTRLALTSVVALGLLLVFWTLSPNRIVAIGVALATGWVLMPTLLIVSLRRPAVRYAVALPASLIGGSLLAMCWSSLPSAPIARAGWLLITAGVLLGALLGAWFWFRWWPVPVRLNDPFSPGRWSLISIHVGLIVAGLALLGFSTLLAKL